MNALKMKKTSQMQIHYEKLNFNQPKLNAELTDEIATVKLRIANYCNIRIRINFPKNDQIRRRQLNYFKIRT